MATFLPWRVICCCFTVGNAIVLLLHFVRHARAPSQRPYSLAQCLVRPLNALFFPPLNALFLQLG